jgi:hypothetical protein
MTACAIISIRKKEEKADKRPLFSHRERRDHFLDFLQMT